MPGGASVTAGIAFTACIAVAMSALCTCSSMVARRLRSKVAAGMKWTLKEGSPSAGRSGEDLLIAFRAVSGLVMGFAQAELAGPLSFEAGEPAAAVIGRMRALPSERYPRLIEIAGAAVDSDPKTEFRGGLDLLLAGLTRPPPRWRSGRSRHKSG